MPGERWPTSQRGLKQLSWQEFEDFVADLYAEKGYETERRQYSGDRRRDVIADRDGERKVIQAKRHTSERLGPGDVHGYSSIALEDDVDKVVLVTANTLTGPGWRTANRIDALEVVTGDQLADWASKYKPRRGVRMSDNSGTQSESSTPSRSEKSGDTSVIALMFILPLKFTVWWFKIALVMTVKMFQLMMLLFLAPFKLLAKDSD